MIGRNCRSRPGVRAPVERGAAVRTLSFLIVVFLCITVGSAQDGSTAADSGSTQTSVATDTTSSTDASSSGTSTDPTPGTTSSDSAGVIPLFQPAVTSDGTTGPIAVDYFGGIVFGPLVTPPSFSSMAVTRNEHAVAAQLDAINGSATGNVAQLLSQIQSLSSPAAQQTALSSMSGEVYGTIQTLGLQLGDRSLRTISNRIINNDVFLNDGERTLLGQRDDSQTAGANSLIMRGQPVMASPSAWLQGLGSSGSLHGNGNAAGLGYNLAGFATGIDLGRDESGTIGITGVSDSMRFHTGLNDSGRIQSYQLGAYVVKRLEQLYGFTILNYGHNSYDVTRSIHIGNPAQTASSSFSGNQLGTYGELGYTVESSAARFQPFVGLQYLYLSNGNAFENGTGGTALSIGSASISTLQTHLGARLLHRTWRDRNGFDWTPYMSGRWVCELLGEQAIAVAALSGAPAGASWVVAGNQSGRNFGMFGPGLSLRVTEGISLFANYDQVFGARFVAYNISGGMLLEF